LYVDELKHHPLDSSILANEELQRSRKIDKFMNLHSIRTIAPPPACRVLEDEVVVAEAHVALIVLRNDGELARVLTNLLDNEMAVIALQIVKPHRDLKVFGVCLALLNITF